MRPRSKREGTVCAVLHCSAAPAPRCVRAPRGVLISPHDCPAADV
jgi:hypothetical protein